MTQDESAFPRRRLTPYEATLLNKRNRDFSGTPVMYVMDGGQGSRCIRKQILGDTDEQINASATDPQIRVVSLQRVLDHETQHGRGPGDERVDQLNRAAKEVGKMGAILIEDRDTDAASGETIFVGYP